MPRTGAQAHALTDDQLTRLIRIWLSGSVPSRRPGGLEDSLEGYLQTSPYQCWNWLDACDAAAPSAWRFRGAIRSGRCPVRRLHASLVTDSLPVQLGLDEGGVKLVERLAGAHGQRGRDPRRLPGDRAAGHVAGGRVCDPVPADRPAGD